MDNVINQMRDLYLKIIPFLVLLTLFCLVAAWAFASDVEGLKVEILAVDPDKSVKLGKDEKLYAKISYQSNEPLRFQAIAMRDGFPIEFGAISNPGALYGSGSGEALVWIFYTSLTHVDSIRVIVRDQSWQELTHIETKVDVTWLEDVVDEKRQLAEWVDPLVKADRRKTDFVYDPSPRRFGLLFDIFFFLNVAALPAYVLLQLHMLYHYRYRWRELAMIPVLPYLIVGFYIIADLGIERSLIITFLFRYTFAAFLWLVLVWFARRYWKDKLPPPKLYKPPKD